MNRSRLAIKIHNGPEIGALPPCFLSCKVMFISHCKKWVILHSSGNERVIIIDDKPKYSCIDCKLELY